MIDASPPEEAEPRRWRRRLGVALGLLLSVGLTIRLYPAPTDRDPTRPERVSVTPFPQQDLMILDGVRVRAIDVGPRDGEAVVIVPGHTARIEGYTDLVAVLRDRFRVVVMDFPGCGYSDKPARDYTLTYYEDALISLLDALALRRVHLVGGSLGGNLVLRLGRRIPDRVDRIVCWAPGSAWPAQPKTAALTRAAACYGLFWPVVKTQSTFWHRDDFPRKEEVLRETFAYYDEVMSPGFVAMYWGIAADTLEHTLFGKVKEIPRPTLLIRGELDTTPYMIEGLQRIDDEMPRSELVTIPNVAHSLQTEGPEQLGKLVREFLTRPKSRLP